MTANDLAVKIPSNLVLVNKCCEKDEIMDAQHHCLHINKSDSLRWSPIFSDGLGKHNLQIGKKSRITIVLVWLRYKMLNYSLLTTKFYKNSV